MQWASDAAAAWSAVEPFLKPHVESGALHVTRLRPSTERALETTLLGEPWHIVHFVGRGTSRRAARYGTLTLEGSDRRARDLNALNFARMCARNQDLALVVLQQAGGEPDAFDVAREALQQGADVICVPSSFAEGTTLTRAQFADRLYRALSAGQSIGPAFAAAAGDPGALRVRGGAEDAAAAIDSVRATQPILFERERPPVGARGRPAAPPARAVETTTAGAPQPAPSQPSGVPPPTAPRAAEPAASRELERKRATGAFDVFLCHNVVDKPAVQDIGRRLMERGILPRLDQWELRPGIPWQRLLEEQIANIRAAAVFVGREGIGPWQRQELDGFLREFNQRGCPVIPVLLPGAAAEPRLPLFLRGMTWVDFRVATPDPVAQLNMGNHGPASRDRVTSTRYGAQRRREGWIVR